MKKITQISVFLCFQICLAQIDYSESWENFYSYYNFKEGEELYGGKVIWNKTNLAGKKVASGVYIVLLTANENSESQITKIAIIN